jgi:transposase InsO family protein
MGASMPFERVCIDVLGPLPRTHQGNAYALVITDWFTKWVEALAVPDQKAETVAEAAVVNVFVRFGLPQILHSDQGRDFESALFRETCRLLGVKKTRTTPWRPQSNGQPERFNRTVEGMLKQVASENQLNWDKYLPFLCAAYRATRHETTGFSPNFMLMGRETPMPLELTVPRPTDDEEQTEQWVPYVESLRERLVAAYSLVRTQLQKGVRRQKERHDGRFPNKGFAIGDWVWLKNPSRKKGVCPKIKNAFEPHPYKVVGKVSDVIVCIKKDHKAKPRVIHINHLLRMCREARDIEEARLIGSEEESEDEEIETAASSSEEISNLEVIDTVEIEAEPIRDIEPVLKTTRGGRVVRHPARYSP